MQDVNTFEACTYTIHADMRNMVRPKQSNWHSKVIEVYDGKEMYRLLQQQQFQQRQQKQQRERKSRKSSNEATL